MDRQGEDAALVDNEAKGLLNDLNFAFKTNDQKLSTFWDNFLKGGHLLLRLIRSERDCFVQTFCYTWMLFPKVLHGSKPPGE
jgi:hypothetical protein